MELIELQLNELPSYLIKSKLFESYFNYSKNKPNSILYLVPNFTIAISSFNISLFIKTCNDWEVYEFPNEFEQICINDISCILNVCIKDDVSNIVNYLLKYILKYITIEHSSIYTKIIMKYKNIIGEDEMNNLLEQHQFILMNTCTL